MLEGLASGGFGNRVDYETGGLPTKIVAADFNKDGRLDLAVTNMTSYSVSVFYGQSGGGLGGRQDFAAGVVYPVGIATGDFDEDGLLDLVVSSDQAKITVLRGLTGGIFGTPEEYAVGGQQAYGVAVGDIDGDGHLDVVVTSGQNDNVSVLYNSIPEPKPLEIAIDIKPGSDPNSINLEAKGVLPVAIFGAEEFDVNDVDLVSLVLEGAGLKGKGQERHSRRLRVHQRRFVSGNNRALFHCRTGIGR